MSPRPKLNAFICSDESLLHSTVHAEDAGELVQLHLLFCSVSVSDDPEPFRDVRSRELHPQMVSDRRDEAATASLSSDTLSCFLTGMKTSRGE